MPPSPTSNSKTNGAGAGDQLRLKQYKVSRSTPVQDAKIPSEGNLRSTKVLQKIGGGAEVPPASREEGPATLPSAVDIVCICPRRLLQSAETTTICHNMHRKHPQNEVSSKTLQWRCAASLRDHSVVCGATPRRFPDSRDAHGVCLNHRLILCETAKHARVHPRSKVRQAWIVSGAINISTRTYITHHHQGLSAAAAWDDLR